MHLSEGEEPFLPSPQFHLSGHAFQTAPPYTPPTTVPARLSPVPSSRFLEAVAAMVQAWYMDESTADPRMPHRAQPDRPVGLEQLRTLGVLYWKVRVQAGAPRACARVRHGGSGGANLGHCASSARPPFPEISVSTEKTVDWWRLLSSMALAPAHS